MSLLDKLSKFEVKSPKPPKNLKPPKPVKIEEIQEKVEPVEFKIDWIKVANSSDFKRAIYLALEGKVWRGTNENLDKELNKKVQVFRDPNFSNVIKDLQEHFKNGLIKPSQMNLRGEK